jgi:hypothetical protein
VEKAPRLFPGSLVKLCQMAEQLVIERPDFVVVGNLQPANHALLIQQEDGGSGDLSTGVENAIVIDDLVPVVRENREWKFEFFRESLILVRRIHTDGNDFGARGFVFFIIRSQTG